MLTNLLLILGSSRLVSCRGAGVAPLRTASETSYDRERGIPMRSARHLLAAVCLLLAAGCGGGGLKLYYGMVTEVSHYGRWRCYEYVVFTLEDGAQLELRIRPGQGRVFRAGRMYRIVYDRDGYLVCCEDCSRREDEFVDAADGKAAGHRGGDE